jgi:hypothetical protein
MKKSAKPLIVTLLLLLALLTGLVLFIVGTRFKYEEMVREKDEVQKFLKSEQTRQINLIAEFQMYCSQRNIVRAAEEELGLIQDFSTVGSLQIDKSELERINNLLAEKYD